MEVVNLAISPERLHLPLPDSIFAGAEKTTFYEDCQRKYNLPAPNKIALNTANTWLHRGKPYYDTQQHEYEELFRFLTGIPDFLSNPSSSILFVDTCPGQAIDEFLAIDKVHEWMACSLESSHLSCPFLPQLQQARHGKSGQPCVFRPQVQAAEDAFTDQHLFCILNAVGQDVSVVVIDGTRDTHYDFQLRIALERLTHEQSFFIWRVTTSFIYHQMALIQDMMMPNFASVHVATLKQHDSYDTHFLIGRNRSSSALLSAQAKQRTETTINRLIDHWLDLARTEYNKYNALAAFMHANGITSQDAADAFWATHSTMFNVTQVLVPHNSTVIE